MNALRWLSSPLMGTAGVMAGLFLISLPLRMLTSAAPAPPPPPVAIDSEKTPAVLRIRLLAPAERVVVAKADGQALLRIDDAPAGESEHDVVLGLVHDGVDLDVMVEGAEGGGETAVFLTVMPDGREERTRYAIGEGDFDEILRFEWPHTN